MPLRRRRSGRHLIGPSLRPGNTKWAIFLLSSPSTP
jgi:hypothetical protein